MAAAVVTVTKIDIWHDTKRIHVLGTIAITAGPATYPANGIPISLVGLEGMVTAQDPERMRIDGLSGYVYTYDSVHKTIRIFEAPSVPPAPLDELAADSAIPAGVSGDTISFDAIVKLV